MIQTSNITHIVYFYTSPTFASSLESGLSSVSESGRGLKVSAKKLCKPALNGLPYKCSSSSNVGTGPNRVAAFNAPVHNSPTKDFGSIC